MVQSLVEMARSLTVALAGLDPQVLSGDDCADLTEALAVTEKACAAARARAALRAGDCGVHRRRGYPSAADWLSRVGGMSTGQARMDLETAGAVERRPATKEALVAGELSLAQAGEITRTEEACPGSEAELLGLARSSGLATLKERARAIRLAAIPADDLGKRRRATRSFRHWLDDLGMVRLAGALPPEVGVGLMNRLDVETDRLRKEAKAEGVDEPREAHAADALVSMLSGQGKGHAQRADVVFVCDLNAYRRGTAEGDEVCAIVGAGPVPVSVVKEATKDAFVKAVLVKGVKIDTVAHLGRHIPAELRTALDLGTAPRFEGAVCSEPGCGRRYGLEWDHTNPWPTAVPRPTPTSGRNAGPITSTRPSGTVVTGSSVVVASRGTIPPDPALRPCFDPQRRRRCCPVLPSRICRKCFYAP